MSLGLVDQLQKLSLFKKSPSKGIYVPLDIDLAQEESSIIISLIKDKLIEFKKQAYRFSK